MRGEKPGIAWRHKEQGKRETAARVKRLAYDRGRPERVASSVSRGCVASERVVRGGRCHQTPQWRWRRSKISSPKGSADCSSPASVGAAARTKSLHPRGSQITAVCGSPMVEWRPTDNRVHRVRRPFASNAGHCATKIKGLRAGSEQEAAGKSQGNADDATAAASSAVGLKKSASAAPGWHGPLGPPRRHTAVSIEARRGLAGSRDKCVRWTV